jgi:hypothetical protein
MMPETIYAYIKQQEALFETGEVKVGDNWDWNFRTHVQLIFHLKNGQFFTGSNGQTAFLRAYKNIMEPMLNLAYWTEDIEVKDVLFFIEGANGRALSFLVKKYHDEVFVRKYDLDTLFDQITETDVDYGGVLVQRTSTGLPEVLEFNNIAFCDQTDILGSPIGFKFNFSPDKLREMASRGWGSEANGATISIEQLILQATFDKDASGTLEGKKNQVPGKSIEVYVVKGTLPESYLEASGDPFDFKGQVQVVAFYTDKDNKRVGVTLYRKQDDGKSLKFHTSKAVYGRALGRGTGESLLHPQVWTNFLTIHKTQMLAAGAKVPLVTDDTTFANKNKINEMENLEVVTVEEGKTIRQVPTAATANIQLYEQTINEWYEYAQLSGSAFDSVLGKQESAGTTFKGQERLVQQGRGMHDRRRGQRAKFIEALYRDFIIPKIIQDITDGTEFLATLSLEEMTWVVDQMTTNHVNRRIVEGMLEGKLMTPEERDTAAQIFRQSFLKDGNKKLITILKEDAVSIADRIGINIAGKQKDLGNLSDKMLSIFQFIFQNPTGFQQAMQIPALATSFNNILEFGGISQADFSTLLTAPAPTAAPAALPQGGAPQGAPTPPPALLSTPAA